MKTNPDYTPDPPKQPNNLPFLTIWLTLCLCTAFAWQIWQSYLNWLAWLLVVCISVLMITATLSGSAYIITLSLKHFLPVYAHFSNTRPVSSLIPLPPTPPPALAAKKVLQIGGEHEI